MVWFLTFFWNLIFRTRLLILSVILEEVKHLNFHSVDVYHLTILGNPLEEVLEAKNMGQNHITELVHKCDWVTFADDDSLLKTIKHLLVHVSLLVRYLSLTYLLFYQSVVDLGEFRDHNEQENNSDRYCFYRVNCHVFCFEISEDDHAKLTRVN